MRNFVELFNELEKDSKYFEEIGNDIIILKEIKYSEYDVFEKVGDEELCRIIYNRFVSNKNESYYDIILVRDKKLYGNKNMDKLFMNEIELYMKKKNSNKVLFSEFMNNFNLMSEFSILYRFRSSWMVNGFNDRFENWCRRSGLLVKEKINVYNRLWLVK